MWEDCANRIIRTSTIEKAILLVTDPEKMTQEELARQVVKASTLHPKPKGELAGQVGRPAVGPAHVVTCSRCQLVPPAAWGCSLNSRVAQWYPRATAQWLALDERLECHWIRAINLWPHAIMAPCHHGPTPMMMRGFHLSARASKQGSSAPCLGSTHQVCDGEEGSG
jgi:hypothetical protein